MGYANSVLKKADIIRHVKTFMDTFPEVPDGQFFVGGGSAGVMLGIRETTNDIDAGMPRELVEQLARDHNLDVEVHGTDEGYLNDNTLLIKFDALATDLHSDHMAGLVCIDGVWCYGPERLLEMKLRLNRPKDQAEISALRNILGVE